MASSQAFVDFVLEQLSGAGVLRARKMFGEYQIYVDEKPLFLVCDNRVLCKTLPCVSEALKDAPLELPYEGGKPCYLLNVDDREALLSVAELLKPNVPVHTPRRKAKAAEHG